MTKKSDTPAIRFKGFTDTWEQRKVSELFRVTRGYVLAATQTETTKTDEKPYPVYSSQTKDKGLMGYYKDYLYEDAITWTTDGANAGTVNYRAGKFYCTNVCGVLLSNEVKANQMIAEALDSVAKGYVSYVGNPKLMNNVMADIVIQIPTQAEEREQLSSFFAKLDNLITLHQRKYDKLTNVKKSMLEKMFPKNGSNVPEIRFKGFTEAWEQRKFEEIAVRSSVICSDANLPRVEYEDIVSGTGRLNKDIYAKQSSKSGIAFHRGDVLYGKLRPYLQNWLLPTFDGLAVGDFWVLQPQNADSSFLYRLIQSRQFDEVANQSTGTKMPRADWKLVSKTVFSIPSNISEQAAIGTYFTALDNLITLHQRELEKLKNIKKSCLENMFV
ncbi:restriction endonuclease subunit S [Ruminococcoides intestinale]|uniref:Restriction endonuclease subunit S n=1 Tax=Ruminococcoides intestinale TaxID=3133162 RepID=A0ABV1F613_9FIRM